MGELQPVTAHKVATIGGRGHAPSGVGTVEWIWKDDEGNTHQYLVEITLYFPQSPINILSVTEFSKQLDDEEGTTIALAFFTGMAISTPLLYTIPCQTYQRCKSIKDSAPHGCTQRWFSKLSTSRQISDTVVVSPASRTLTSAMAAQGATLRPVPRILSNNCLKKARPCSAQLMVGPG